VFEYKNEKCAIECARAAVNIVLKLVRNEEVDTEAIINNLRLLQWKRIWTQYKSDL